MEQNVQAQAKPIQIPGPDHPISVDRNPSRVIISVAGHVIADTREALTLCEAHYPAVHYIPRKDVDMTLLARFLSFERWRRLMARLYWLLAEYQVTCAVFEKT